MDRKERARRHDAEQDDRIDQDIVGSAAEPDEQRQAQRKHRGRHQIDEDHVAQAQLEQRKDHIWATVK